MSTENSFDRKLIGAFAITIVLMAVIVMFYAYYSNQRTITSHSIEQSNTILIDAAQILSHAKDIESGGRGYVITGDSIYLEYFTIGKNDIFNHVKTLRDLIGNNPFLQLRIDSLSILIAKRIEFSDRCIQLRNEKGFAVANALVISRQGKRYMDKIRVLISELQSDENTLLIQQKKEYSRSIVFINYTFFPFLASVLVLMLIILFSIRNKIAVQKQGKEQNRKIEEQIQIITNSAPDAVIVMDVEGRIIKWNPKAETLFGWRGADVIGKPLSDIIIPLRYREAHKKGLEVFSKTGKGPILGKSIEIHAINKDDVEFDISLTVSHTSIDGNNVFIGFIRDITDRKKIQDSLARLNDELEQKVIERTDKLASSERLYRSLFENMLHGFAYCKVIFDHDKAIDYIYTAVNSAYESLTGLKDVLGKKVSEAIPGLLESDPGYFDMITRVELSGKSEKVETFVKPLNRWFSISVYSPEKGFIVALVDNITERKQAEEKLIQSQARLNEAQSITHIGNWEIDFTENFQTTWSEEIYSIYGINKEESLPSLEIFLSFMHPDDLTFAKKNVETAMASCSDASFDFRFIRKDGATRYGHTEWRFECDKSGKPLRLFGITQDITEKKEAQQQMAFNQNNLYSLINNTHDVMWSVDKNLRLITSNHAFDLMVKAISGSLPAIGSSALLDGFSEDQLSRFKQYYERALSGKTFTEIEYSKYPSEFWSEISFNPILKEGVIMGTACFSRNITERKKYEKIIKDERILLRTLIDNLPVIVYTKDIYSRKTLSNRADYEYAGAHSEEEVLRKDDSYFFSAKSAQETILEDQQVFASGQPIFGKEEAHKKKDGTTTWFLITKIPLRNQDMETVGLIGISYDITQRKQSEIEIHTLNARLEEKVVLRTTQLEAANKELEGFTYSVSHDLRAPLRIIDGFSQILIDDYAAKLDDEGKKIIEVIMGNARRMGQLIDDLLNFSRIGRTSLNKSTVDMNQLVLEAVHELQASGIVIPRQLTIGKLKPAKADASLMKQVWINLVGNGIKYSIKKEEPAIEIGMKDDTDEKVYFVKDNGAGFNMKYYSKLFGVFQRLHNQEEFIGTGVGLALVQRIITRHGGTIWAEAIPGKGATFYFSLPNTAVASEVTRVTNIINLN